MSMPMQRGGRGDSPIPGVPSLEAPTARAHIDPPLDLEQLSRRCMGNVALLERLLESFEGRFPAELSQIEQCLIDGDDAAMVRQVHQLKGAAANVSAPALHAAMSRLEEAARGHQNDEVNRCLATVWREWDRFKQYKTSTQAGTTD